jgi:hypothetical protein
MNYLKLLLALYILFMGLLLRILIQKTSLKSTLFYNEMNPQGFNLFKSITYWRSISNLEK